MDDMSHAPQHERNAIDPFPRAMAWSAVTFVVLVLLGYGAAGSYESLSHLAAANAVPLPRFAPIGLDGGLLGAIILDIVLTWLGRPIGFLRQFARLLGLCSIAGNAWAGWPDPVSVFMRIFAPLLIVVISEAIRAYLLRRRKGEADPVPLSRWLLALPSTFRLWRRMKLWGIRSYSDAIDMELSRLGAMAALTDRYGDGWRAQVPGTLTWMLDAGVRMDDALKTTAELTAAPSPDVQPARSGVNRTRASGAKRRTKSGPARRTPSVPLDPEMEGLSGEAQVWMLMQREPGISGPEIGRRLGLSESYACRMKKKLAAEAPATGPMARIAH